MKDHPLISAGDLAGLLASGSPVLLDCRFDLQQKDWGRQAYLAGHIPGAFFMDIEHDLSGPVTPGVTGRHPLPHPEVILATFRAAGIDTSRPVVVYDQGSGMYAVRAWWLLRWLGYARVQLLDGGFAAWTALGGPTDNTWPAPHETSWMAIPDMDMLVERETLAAGMAAPVVDSRDFIRYTGEFEPIDPVAGHIPGAICRPFAENLTAEGIWKSADDLRERFSDLVVAPDAPTPVFYCGSGVSACHNIFAYYMATGRMARLYAGSWSEWIHYHAPALGEK